VAPGGEKQAAVCVERRANDAAVVAALKDFDELYPQPNGQSALQQLQVQLAKPLPFDLEDTRLDEYKILVPKWQDWANVESVASRIADLILDHLDA